MKTWISDGNFNYSLALVYIANFKAIWYLDKEWVEIWLQDQKQMNPLFRN